MKTVQQYNGGVRFNVWVLFALNGAYTSRWCYIDANNFIEMQCEREGLSLRYTLYSVVNGVGTVLKTGVVAVAVSSEWINVQVGVVYECTTDKVQHIIQFSDSVTSVVVEYDLTAYNESIFNGWCVCVGADNGTHIDGTAVFCALYHVE